MEKDTTNEEITDTLNGLIETCRDGEEGYRQAADGVKDTQIQSLFLTYAQQRGQFASELQAEVRRLGGDPEKSGSMAGSLHRGWINIKSAVTDRDENAVLAECERGDKSAVQEYEDALESIMDTDLRDVIMRQYQGIRSAYERVRSLERITA